jgi:hypothetical protein
MLDATSRQRARFRERALLDGALLDGRAPLAKVVLVAPCAATVEPSIKGACVPFATWARSFIVGGHAVMGIRRGV